VIGQTISHYKILSKLGEGGMGVVYKAEDLSLRRTVALKFLPANTARSDRAKARFRREARAAAALQHSNICTVYEVGEANEQPFIAMAYIEGVELGDEIEKGPLDPDRLIGIAVQIAEGLEEAHDKGVVHRDIKPANIMVTSRSQVVLMDFGLAQISSAASKLTREGATVGTSFYMSPEQATGKQLDDRTDIWALGVVLYEMATGKLPFQGHYEQAVLYSILNDAQEPITAVPPELERIVGKCLAKSANERYQSVTELLTDLKALKRRTESGDSAQPSAEKTDDRPSIAVLPFENRSRGDEDEYFSDGISEDITSALVKLARLRVAPRSQSFQFKGKRPTLEEVGRTLNVGHILEGSVRRSGDRIRINVELIAIDEGYEVWSERYDRVIEDIFDVQDEISQAIVEQLKIQLVGQETESLTARRTENLTAYNLCLRGRYSWYKRTAQGINKAMGYFEQALAEDPNYTLAHTGLADCYILSGFYGSMSVPELLPRAEVATRKALELDPDLAAGHASLGAIQALYHWEWNAAEREFLRAIELDPSYPLSHLWYAIFVLSAVGRTDEALAEWKRAADLDPITPIVNMGAGAVLLIQRRYDEAVVELRKLLDLDPNYFWFHHMLGRAYLQLGDYEKAIPALERGRTGPWGEGHLGYGYAVSGDADKARNLIVELRARPLPEHLLPYHLALIHLGLGEHEEGLHWLEQALEQRSAHLYWILVTPEVDSVRGDPGFQAILRRMNLAK